MNRAEDVRTSSCRRRAAIYAQLFGRKSDGRSGVRQVATRRLWPNYGANEARRTGTILSGIAGMFL